MKSLHNLKTAALASAVALVATVAASGDAAAATTGCGYHPSFFDNSVLLPTLVLTTDQPAECVSDTYNPDTGAFIDLHFSTADLVEIAARDSTGDWDGPNANNYGPMTAEFGDGDGNFSFTPPRAPHGQAFSDFYIKIEISLGTGVFQLADGDVSGSWGAGNVSRYDNPISRSARLYGRLEPAPVPLPATGALLIAGLGAFGAMRRRSKKA